MTKKENVLSLFKKIIDENISESEKEEYYTEIRKHIKRIVSNNIGYNNLNESDKEDLISNIFLNLFKYMKDKDLSQYTTMYNVINILYKISMGQLMSSKGAIKIPSYIFSNIDKHKDKYDKIFFKSIIDDYNDIDAEKGNFGIVKETRSITEDYNKKYIIDYIINNLINNCSDLEKDIFYKRLYILDNNNLYSEGSGIGRKTILNSIGKKYGITSERVRQIENKLMNKIKLLLKRIGVGNNGEIF